MVAERLLRRTLEPYGRMLNLSVDSRRKTARIELLLHGEDEPILLTIDQYEWVLENSQAYLVVRKARASRAWIDALIQQLGLNRKIPVPEAYCPILRMVL